MNEILPPEKNKGGRPLKFETAEALQEAVDGYFAKIKDERGMYVRPPTVSGLALHLDISTRTLLGWEKGSGNAGFFPIIKRAKQECEAFLEEQAIIGKSRNPISLLSMNFGRVEKTQVNMGVADDLADTILTARKRLRDDTPEN